MNDPIAILHEIVERAREIPALLDEVDGNPGRIYAWVDRLPGEPGLVRAMGLQEEKSAMFALEGVRPGPGDGAWWTYRYVVSLRPRHEMAPAEGGVWRMFRALANGKTADGQRFVYRCFAPFTESARTLTADRRRLLRFGDEAIELLVGVFDIHDREA